MLRTSLVELKGVGPTRARQLARHGLHCVGDLLYHLPFRYEDRRRVTPIAELEGVGGAGGPETPIGATATIVAEVIRVRGGRVRHRGGRGRFGAVFEAVVRDATGAATLVWFHHTASIERRCPPGTWLRIHGRVEPGPKLYHPEIEVLGAADTVDGDARGDDVDGVAARIVPVYTRPGGMPPAFMRRLVGEAVRQFGGRLRGALPGDVLERHGLVDLADALRQIHTPPGDSDVESLNGGSTVAHRTLAFDELFCLQLGLALRRSTRSVQPGLAFAGAGEVVPEFSRHLPFALTGAQRRVLGEVLADMESARPMHRLIQGDVGSGKTVVALLAALVAHAAGCQAAVMAPTEVLAEQHARTFRELLTPLGLEPVLLTGAVTGAERSAALATIERGGPAIVVGTHALVQKTVRFAKLGLAVIDEQHRFGVLQRARLGKRRPVGGAWRDPLPDVLVMTATPIPRTLAMTVYGDLDVSYLDELPPGRQPVCTRVLPERERERAYTAVRAELERGRQAFVVLPLVEDSTELAVRSAVGTAEELRGGVFEGYRVGLVHGRMPPAEKDAVMHDFRQKAYDVLVCTTVIEVGIDVPNAAVIVVEHADRFGLAQLHQLRGRVGRGQEAASCHLIASADCSALGFERLRVLRETNDGFEIGEADLRIRGPGEFLGTRQAGLPEFRVARLLRDTALLEAAREEARRHLEAGAGPRTMARHIVDLVGRHRWADRLGLAEVG